MRKLTCCMLVVTAAGCDGLQISLDLGSILSRTMITLRLVNTTESTVTPSVFVSDTENLIFEGLTESFLTLDANAQNFPDLLPGEARERRYDCDDFRAVMAEDAVLRSSLGLSQKDSTQILIEDDDFSCGDAVVITYSGGLLDFDANIGVDPGGA